MHNNICYIFGAGEFFGADIVLKSGDYVIAADGGYKNAEQIGLNVDLLIGDFDSLGNIPNIENVVVGSADDDTDMMLAIKTGLLKGYKNFYIYGATGGRFDHTISNIQSITYISKQNCNGLLFGKKHISTVITNSNISFGANMKGYISVLALDKLVSGITIKGLKYNVENVNATNDYPFGTSNEFIGKAGSISVKDGSLLIIYEIQS